MRLLAIIALLACAGCVNRYVVPPDAPTATVIFSSETEPVMVQAFADRKCGRNPAGNRVAYFYKDLFDQRTGTAKPVVAGREFVFTFHSREDSGNSVRNCTVTKAFVPEAGQTYRAHFHPVPAGCNVAVTRGAAPSADSTAASPVEVVAVVPECFNSIDG